MLRKLVLLLLLGNLILWAWSHGALAGFGWAAPGAGEPQRLREQVHASSLTLLGPDGQPVTASVPAGPAAPASPPASSPASSPGSSPGSSPASSPASSASAASSAASSPASAASSGSKARAPGSGSPAASSATGASASAPAPAATASHTAAPARGASGTLAQAAAPAATCLRIGPYTDQADAKLGAALHAAGLQSQAQRQDLPEQWMVLMGPYANTADLQRKLDELRRLSLPAGSFIQVTGRPRYEPGISLGVFDQRAQAQTQLKRLQAHGVQTAHVVQRNLGMQAFYWVLPALDAAQAQRLRALPALHAAGMHAQDCPAH